MSTELECALDAAVEMGALAKRLAQECALALAALESGDAGALYAHLAVQSSLRPELEKRGSALRAWWETASGDRPEAVLLRMQLADITDAMLSAQRASIAVEISLRQQSSALAQRIDTLRERTGAAAAYAAPPTVTTTGFTRSS